MGCEAASWAEISAFAAAISVFINVLSHSFTAPSPPAPRPSAARLPPSAARATRPAPRPAPESLSRVPSVLHPQPRAVPQISPVRRPHAVGGSQEVEIVLLAGSREVDQRLQQVLRGDALR